MKTIIFKLDADLLSQFNKIRINRFCGTSRQKLMEKIIYDWVKYYNDKKI